jgi:hypothetical protein
MSAFMCSDAHISAILSAWKFADVHDYDKLDDEKLRTCGQLLAAANGESVMHRYHDILGENRDAVPPAAILAPQFKLSRKIMRSPPTPIAALKLIHSLDYQSCEPDNWEASEARKLLYHIERAIIHAMPGYDEAAWSI